MDAQTDGAIVKVLLSTAGLSSALFSRLGEADSMS